MSYPQLTATLLIFWTSQPIMVRFSFCKNPLEAGNVISNGGAPFRSCPFHVMITAAEAEQLFVFVLFVSVELHDYVTCITSKDTSKTFSTILLIYTTISIKWFFFSPQIASGQLLASCLICVWYLLFAWQMLGNLFGGMSYLGCSAALRIIICHEFGRTSNIDRSKLSASFYCYDN